MWRAEPVWIRTDTVLAIHKRLILKYGGTPGVRDLALLEAAINRPQRLFANGNPGSSIPELAAAYACGLVQTRPFVDSNTRTALVTCRFFLDLIGYDIGFSALEKYHYASALAAGKISEKHFARLIAGDAKMETPFFA